MSTTRTRARPATRRAPAPPPPRRRPRVPMDARIRQRRAEVRRAQLRRRRRLVGAVVLLLLGGGAAIGVTRSPLFAVTAVKVEGVKGERAALVREAAQVRNGENVMTANLDGAVHRTRALPWVAQAEVRREPPSTVVIAVVPRRPAAVVEVDDKPWVVDAQGVVIEQGARRALPRIALTVPVIPVPGEQLGDAAALNALELHAVLPRDVRRAADTLEAVGARTVRVELALSQLDDPAGFAKSRRVWVRLGSAGDVGEQVSVLRALLGQRKSDRQPLPTEVDVRVPDNPVVIP